MVPQKNNGNVYGNQLLIYMIFTYSCSILKFELQKCFKQIGWSFEDPRSHIYAVWIHRIPTWHWAINGIGSGMQWSDVTKYPKENPTLQCYGRPGASTSSAWESWSVDTFWSKFRFTNPRSFECRVSLSQEIFWVPFHQAHLCLGHVKFKEKLILDPSTRQTRVSYLLNGTSNERLLLVLMGTNCHP